jgi:hypothetical protein
MFRAFILLLTLPHASRNLLVVENDTMLLRWTIIVRNDRVTI